VNEVHESSSNELALVRHLEALVVDNKDLERLEDLLNPFNVFEALGAVSQEVRHSNFLAFLLNPSQNHGLGEHFARRFLQRVLQAPGASTAIRPVELDLIDLSRLEVRREWQAIDVLLIDPTNEFVVIIENKVYSSEHSDQLARYWSTAHEYFPGYRRVGIFLSPDGLVPTHPDYIPFGYDELCSLVESIIEARGNTLSQDLRMMMLHYSQMLRRHFMETSEVAELARRIYQKHQKALDLILEYRPDRQAEIRDILIKLISENPQLILDHSSKAWILFGLSRWDDVSPLRGGAGWTKSGRMLLFEIQNDPTRVSMRLTVGPGPDQTRASLFQIALMNKPPFKTSQGTLAKSWNMIYQRTFLTGAKLLEEDMENLSAHLRREWHQFVEQALPEIDSNLSANGF
jgi:hypothetical protein